MDGLEWQARFSSKLTTADQAVRRIDPARRILIGSGVAEPRRLVEALVANCSRFVDNEIVHLLTMGPAPYVGAGMERHFRHMAFFIGPNVRKAVHEGRADFMPVFLSELPLLIRSRRVRLDVAMIQVSPPDRHGYVSLGVSVDIVRAAVESADLILAEVNPNMPRTLGNSFLHVDKIDLLVPVDEPLPELIPDELDGVSREIGRHVASLIPNGATLQTGIGKIPDAVVSELANHHDLGVHTEMLSDGVMKLVETGVITGAQKSLLPGKLVTSFVMGTRRLYEWVHDNPCVEMRPSDFTNDPFIIARNDRMIAVNSALAIDLTGQVASDTLGGRFFSGIGGQVDFIRGAARSKGGKPILAFRSTAKRGSISRIQPVLEEGAGIVTSRGDVHFVVTEYGVADLWGKNIRQRAMALIEIAHPDYRAELLASAKKRRYVFPEQLVPRAVVPWQETRTECLDDGERILIRPVKLSDHELLQDFFYRLADPRTFRRFLAYTQEHACEEEMRNLAALDFEQNLGLVAIQADGEAEEILGVARYDVIRATRMADIAIVVRDDWRGRGLGTRLVKRIGAIASARGLAGFAARVRSSNKSMMMLLHKTGLKVSSRFEEGTYKLEIRFE